MERENTYNRRNTTVNGKICIEYIPQEDVRYPKRLRLLPGMPRGLYVCGRLPQDGCPSVAIVGARSASVYGSETARRFARKLAEAGVQIISGMAWGIDGKAHEGALEAGGDTFGVLGCGVDICYPAGHRRLYERLRTEGGLISEQPPGMPPKPGHFPARNRIISGLADLVLVVEARERSGSLITADLALEQGRDVYALPGPVNSDLSRGCNRLIQQGAGILLSPEMLLKEWDLAFAASVQKEDKNEKVLETPENLVYSCLGLYPKDLNQIVSETKLDIKEVLEKLVSLELQGYVREISKNHYIISE